MKSTLAFICATASLANAAVSSSSGIRAGVSTLISSSSGFSIQDVTSTTTTPTVSQGATTTTSGNPDTSITTSTPSVTAALNAPLPSQAALPPVQAWCPSKIFCAGKILQTLNIATPYSDSKTIVDKPTNGTANATITAFDAFGNNITYGQVVEFLDDHFQGEGLELEATNITAFPASPSAFAGIQDPYVKGFTLEVHKIWPLLVRDTNESRVCENGKCESTLIPLNHTFVVPGGRFREQYYWDSKFILEGLIKSELYSVANSTLQNFMDEIEQFGFIPNGGRIYYLNRSQPPVFAGMVLTYYNATHDDATLARALPILEKEMQWWDSYRSFNVTSPYSNQTHTVYHYSVNNTAPRPESYLEDYETVNGADVSPAYTDDQKAALYSELASGAETGWDYSSRWTKNPYTGNATDQNPILRTLNVRNTTAVDLNSILYKAHIDIANLYDLSAATLAKRVLRRAPSESADQHRAIAATLKTAILDLFWDPQRLAFYDFNRTSNARNTQLTAAHWYPLWAGIIPDVVKNNATAAFETYSSLNMVMRKYNGTIPATYITTGLQWDFPNAWPPHIWFALEALANVPANVSTAPIPQAPGNNSFNLLPSNQLGIPETQLPLQTTSGNDTVSVGQDINAGNGTVFNGGNSTASEGWVKTLQREVANRYFTSVYCSWYTTGGSIPGLLPRLDNATLAITQSTDQYGHLFEKFSALNVDSAGRGGEYAVQAGFGWTNGVLLWVAAEFQNVLVKPSCPNVTAENQTTTGVATGDALASAGFGWLPAVVTMVLVMSGLVL